MYLSLSPPKKNDNEEKEKKKKRLSNKIKIEFASSLHRMTGEP